MLTRIQKEDQIKEIKQILRETKNLVFADFTGVPTKMIEKLKAEIRGPIDGAQGKPGAQFRVFKKRLLKIALRESGFTSDPSEFPAQVGTMFLPEELTASASIIYKFALMLAKAKKEFKVLGAYDMATKTAMTREQFIAIAKLPSREILLGQVLGGFTGPLRAFMNLVDQLSKKVVA